MGTEILPAKRLVGRREDCYVLNTTLDREALELLYRYCPPGGKTTGKFLARLVYEYHARREERERLRKALAVEGEEDL